MTINLTHSPILKLNNVDDQGQVEVRAGTDVKALLADLGVPEKHQRYVLVYINGKKQTSGYTLRQDDTVQLFLPIGGG